MSGQPLKPVGTGTGWATSAARTLIDRGETRRQAVTPNSTAIEVITPTLEA